MKKEFKKFLEFNGKTIYFLAVNGVYWIAIKPICEALNVNYDRQYKNLTADKILGQLYATQHMVAKDNKTRSMVCLPEFFVYGWIFQIQSESEDLLQYKWKCYELIYNFFHGTITNREQFLKEKTLADIEIEQLEEELKENTAYKRIQELKKTQRLSNSGLKKLDNKYVQDQLEIWTQDLKAKYPI